MNLSKLTKELAQQANLTQNEADAIIHRFIDIIKASMFMGDKVIIAGFGTFEMAKREARKARNPQTGEQVDIPTRIAPKFKPSRAWKEQLNNLGVKSAS